MICLLIRLIYILFSNPTNFLTYPYAPPQRPEESAEVSYPLHPLQPRYPLDSRPKSPIFGAFGYDSLSSSTNPCMSPHSISVPSTTADLLRPPSRNSQLQGVIDRVTAPYDYTEGYHFLMKHLPTRYVVQLLHQNPSLTYSFVVVFFFSTLPSFHLNTHMLLTKNRFEKNDILRIVRALAIYRPSLIALQMPLSLDDEIFVEKCFQRSLLVSVWRFSGEGRNLIFYRNSKN